MMKYVRFFKPLTTVHVVVDQLSAASSKPKVEFKPHVNTCVVGDIYLVIYGHNRNVKVYTHNPNGENGTRTVMLQYAITSPKVDQRMS